MFKVLSGVLRPGDRLRNTTTGVEERIPALFRLRGAEHLHADAFRAGEVGAVAKLTGTPAGSLLWSRPQGKARPIPAPDPGARLRDDARAGVAVRRREAHDRAGAAHGRRPDPRRRPVGKHDDPARPGRYARRGRRRAAGAGARGSRDHRERARRLPRDDRANGRSGGQAQEAVGRPRTVRRRAAAPLATAARRWLRVRRLRRRRGGSALIHPGRRDAAPASRSRPGVRSATPSSTCRSSCWTGRRTRSTHPRWPSAPPLRSA